MGIEYQQPFRSFRFLVEVESSGVIAAAFTQFSGVKMEVQTIQARSGGEDRGVQEYIPTLTSFAPVTLTKGVVGDNDFLDWLFSAGASHNAGPSGGDDMRRTLNVIALNEAGKPGVTWSLKDAMPIGYELTPMDGGRSEVLSESMTFAITGMERITHPPEEGQ
ncbi:MAG: phage tail protein [Ruminococcaceae bacterium]|nr:phage tail protein [Oscillospiraceae bacterium]